MAAAAFQLIKTLAGIVLLGATLSAQTDPGPVNVADRESARAWFNTWWPKTHGADMGFTGNVSTGVAGDTTQTYKDQALLRINVFRRMAGVLPITLDATASAKAQSAALLCAANDQISHSPPTTWKFYSAVAADACAKSLLASVGGSEGIYSLMFDAGGNNAAVGHRLDLLEPQLTSVGLGNAPSLTAANLGYEAVYKSGLLSTIPRYSVPFIAWPYGYTPSCVVPGRWSLYVADDVLVGSLDLSSAQVEVTKDGQALPVRFWALAGGPAIVFTLDGTDEGWSQHVPVSTNGESLLGLPVQNGDWIYHVKVSGIKARTTGALWSGTGTYEYDVAAFNANVGTVTPGQTSDLINISTRSLAGTGNSTQIAGFIASGAAPGKVLIRAGGPWLSQFGVAGVLADPVLTLFEGQTVVATNDNWSANLSEISAAVAKAGAMPFAANSKDAALVATLKPGIPYTAHVTGKGAETGNAIVEVYDVADASSARIINISTRSFVGTGGSIQIGGFILRGIGPRKVLIRASGPYLTQFGVGDVLPDPILNVFKTQELIATNDDWSTFAAEIDLATSAAGVTPFAAGSKDAALVLTLDPGVPYTAQVSGKGNGTGNALIEVYALP
jgi:hypothetical protein